MASMASKCCTAVGLDREVSTLEARHAVALLSALRTSGLTAKSVACYYGAFKRAMTLGGSVNVQLWPNAPTPPRRTRDKLSEADIARLFQWLRKAGYPETADLGVLLAATGMRIAVEGLRLDAWRVAHGDTFDTLHITGKGGHERVIPVVEPEARAFFKDMKRLEAVQGVPYTTHLKRWKRGTAALGVTSRLPTPHAVRHAYASRALEKSGGNLTMVQQLLGHSDPATTARYLHVDLTAKAKALS
jgi:site-specific recombinase XerD